MQAGLQSSLASVGWSRLEPGCSTNMMMTMMMIFLSCFSVSMQTDWTSLRKKRSCWPFISFFSPMGQQPLVGQVLLIIEASLSHSDTPHSVGLLWKSDQPDVEAWTWQHTTLKTDINASGGIRTRNSSKRSKALSLDSEGTGIGVGHLYRPEMQVCWRMFLEVSCGA